MLGPALKVGLIVDDENLSRHDYELVQWANSVGTLRISHLIVQVRGQSGSSRSFLWRLASKNLSRLVTAFLWRIKNRSEGKEVEAIEAFRYSNRVVAAAEIVPGRIFVRPIVSNSGFVYRFSEDDLGKIRTEGFDLLIRCGTGILRGGILVSARLGILSFHHGDNRINRGGPEGFWEVYHGMAKTGFVVQRLTEELDGGDVLLRGFVPTQRTHLMNRALLFNRSYFHLRTLLSRIAQTGRLPAAEAHVPYSGKLYVAPGAKEISVYFAKRVRRTVVARTRSVLGHTERWGVCFLRGDWSSAAFWRAQRIETPPGRFLADPFVVTRAGRSYAFVEDYVYRAKKGRISVFALDDAGACELGVVLDEPFHLSFPFTFEFRGALFMCPESIGANEVRVYRCLSFPLKWTLECILMGGVRAADSMIFEGQGLWWLLTNLSEAQPEDHSSELHIFSARHPLSREWIPHPRNPVIIDPSCARNAGLLHMPNGLVRVSQSQGFGSYGASANLMRITRLDVEAYAEELICRLTPEFLRGAHGTHHLHSDGVYSVWDYKRWERVPT